MISRSWRLQIETITVALVVAVHEDDHGQTLCYVVFGGKVDGKWLRQIGNDNVGLHDAISICRTVFSKGSLCVAPFNMTSELLKLRHIQKIFWRHNAVVFMEENFIPV